MPDGITDFEIFGFTKTGTSQYLENKENIFLRIKGYFITTNSFVAEVTFNTRNRELSFKITL